MKKGFLKKIKKTWLPVFLSVIIFSGNLSLTGNQVSAAEGDSSPSFDGFYEVLDDPAAGSSGQDLDFIYETIPDQKEDASEQNTPEPDMAEPDAPEQDTAEQDVPEMAAPESAAPEQNIPLQEISGQMEEGPPADLIDEERTTQIETEGAAEEEQATEAESIAAEEQTTEQEDPAAEEQTTAEEGPAAEEQTISENGSRAEDQTTAVAAAAETEDPLQEGHNNLILTTSTADFPFTPQKTDWYLFWTGDEYSLSIKDKDGAVLSPLILGERPCYSLSEGVEYTVSLQTVMELETVYTSLGIVELLTIGPDIQAVAGYRESFMAYAEAGNLYLTSSDPDVVEVVQNTSIELLPLKAGTAVISACIEGTNIRKDCRVTVVEPVLQDSYVLSAQDFQDAVDGKPGMIYNGVMKNQYGYVILQPADYVVNEEIDISALPAECYVKDIKGNPLFCMADGDYTFSGTGSLKNFIPDSMSGNITFDNFRIKNAEVTGMIGQMVFRGGGYEDVDLLTGGTVTGGTFTDSDLSGNWTIHSGTFRNCMIDAFDIQGGDFTDTVVTDGSIHGGTFLTDTDDYAVDCSHDYSWVTIYGGHFRGKKAAVCFSEDRGMIYGGIFEPGSYGAIVVNTKSTAGIDPDRQKEIIMSHIGEGKMPQNAVYSYLVLDTFYHAVAGTDGSPLEIIAQEPEPVVRKPQTIAIKAASAAIVVGNTTSLTVTGAKGKLSYQSSEPSIATVSQTGKINARKVGRTVITVTAAQTADYNAVSKNISIKVLPAATTSFKAANLSKGIRLSWAKVAGATGYVIYRNNKKAKIIQSGSALTWTDTAANTNGTKNTYRIIARAPLGDSPLSKTLTTWRLAPPAVTAVRNTASLKATVTYTKNTRATGYQIQYNTLRTFKTGNRAVNINSASTTSRTLSKLTKGKTWYVRVRAFKTVNGTRYCSSWSTVRVVKILK